MLPSVFKTDVGRASVLGGFDSRAFPLTEPSEELRDLRSLPAVGAVLSRPDTVRLVAEHGHAVVAAAVRAEVARCRAELEAGRPATFSPASIARAAADASLGTLVPVINATGILVHTNLGRVPLARAALEAIERASGYGSLELDLETGRRGHRHAHAVELLRALTGAEDALVVNNNAAAVLLALGTVAAGKEAIVSRGELVEIGGGFRIPEVIAQAGARLREVGTTNRTHLADYARAIGDATAAILKVHRSNFEVRGFVHEVGAAELAALARARGVVLVHDAGSGCMPEIAEAVGEPSVADLVRAGADLVTFSGDKLLGGPQAGIVVGRAELCERLRRAPIYRALRPDKTTLAALRATLVLWRDRPDEIPLVRMIREPLDRLEARGRRVSTGLEIVPSVSRIGGGAAPSVELPSRAVRIASADAEALARGLRLGAPPVLGRIEDGALLLDLRTVSDDDVPALAGALEKALGTAP